MIYLLVLALLAIFFLIIYISDPAARESVNELLRKKDK